MNRVTIDLEALRHNFDVIHGLMSRQGSSWSVVTKALCGHEDTIHALWMLGARSVADSRLDKLRAVSRAAPELEKWYLRLPHLSVVDQVVALSNVSLDTEIDVIEALSREAVRQDRTHNVVIMIELGDLREGIVPGSLIPFYRKVFDLPNIQVIGIGGQVGCMAGAIPNVDQVAQLLLYRELLELKFSASVPIVSAGSSIFLSLILEGKMPRGVNHYRIGEALFLGTDLVTGGKLLGLRDDVICLEAEIAEIKEKNLVPLGETTTSTPFEAVAQSSTEAYQPGRRGYRALVTVGQLDTDVGGLTPLDANYQIAGASSDITAVNLGSSPDGLGVGDTIKFKTNYAAFVRLMNDPYIRKELVPARPAPAPALRARRPAHPRGAGHASVVAGYSHKCGHDGHMAIVCGLAALLGRRPLERGSAILLFQPAEETGEGAARVLADARFEELAPDEVLALHNLPGFPLGAVVVRRGAFASASTGIVIELHGATSHAAEPEKGRSPAMAVAQLIQGLSAAPQLFTGLHEAAKVTVIHARVGEVAFGTSPGQGVVMATLRAHDDAVLRTLSERCVAWAARVASAWGLEYSTRWVEPFPGTVNHAATVEAVEAAARGAGLAVLTPPRPFQWSEDFGNFTARYPGALFGLGAGETQPVLHHPDYDFPDELLWTGATLLESVVRARLRGAGE